MHNCYLRETSIKVKCKLRFKIIFLTEFFICIFQIGIHLTSRSPSPQHLLNDFLDRQPPSIYHICNPPGSGLPFPTVFTLFGEMHVHIYSGNSPAAIILIARACKIFTQERCCKYNPKYIKQNCFS